MDNTYVPSIGSAVLAGLAFAQFACAFAGVLLPAGDIVFWVLAVAAVALAGIGSPQATVRRAWCRSWQWR